MIEELREDIIWSTARKLCRAWAADKDLSDAQLAASIRHQAAPGYGPDYAATDAEVAEMVPEAKRRANDKIETDVNWEQWAFHGR